MISSLRSPCLNCSTKIERSKCSKQCSALFGYRSELDKENIFKPIEKKKITSKSFGWIAWQRVVNKHKKIVFLGCKLIRSLKTHKAGKEFTEIEVNFDNGLMILKEGSKIVDRIIVNCDDLKKEFEDKFENI
jgi:hypothetical protein